jgi:hypothetical protein
MVVLFASASNCPTLMPICLACPVFAIVQPGGQRAITIGKIVTWFSAAGTGGMRHDPRRTGSPWRLLDR